VEKTPQFLLMCSTGCFHQPHFLHCTLAGAALEVPWVLVSQEEDMRCPSRESLNELQLLAPQLLKAAGRFETPDMLVLVIEACFKDVGVVFEPQKSSSTIAILEVKSKEIASRIKKKAEKGASSGGVNAVANKLRESRTPSPPPPAVPPPSVVVPSGKDESTPAAAAGEVLSVPEEMDAVAATEEFQPPTFSRLMSPGKNRPASNEEPVTPTGPITPRPTTPTAPLTPRPGTPIAPSTPRDS